MEQPDDYSCATLSLGDSKISYGAYGINGFEVRNKYPMNIANSAPIAEPESHLARADETTAGDVIRVLLADSQAIYRAGVCKILTREPGIQVVAEVDSISSLHSALNSFPSDILLLEAKLASVASDAIPELVRRAPDTKIIIETAESEQSDTVEFYRHGVSGVIPRSTSATLLVESVRKVAAGETWIDNETVKFLIARFQAQTAELSDPTIQPPLSALSAKEGMIMTGVTQGMKNKDIAIQLSTTEQTIKNCLSKVYKKLGVSDRLELAFYCQRHGSHMDRSAMRSAAD